MEANEKRRGGKSASDRRKKLRSTLWPDVLEGDLWLRQQKVGFTTIPRVMPLIGQMLDIAAGKGTPVFNTYLTLWCWVYDEALVEIRNQKDFALESGFSGPRAEGTWKSRMKILENLGLIKSKKGLTSDYQYVLLLNPIKIVNKIYENNRASPLYVSFVGRLSDIGADDLD